MKKLKKEEFKTNNIKILLYYNPDFSFNFKVNIHVFELTKSSKSVLNKETNSTYLFFNVS